MTSHNCGYVTDGAEQWQIVHLMHHSVLVCIILGYNEKCAVEKDENKNVHVSDKLNEGLSHSEPHSCHKATFKWMELQKAAQLTLIRHIRDVAAQNKLSSFKQKLITDYIEYDSN
ncbi:hypothetical protein T01_13979 [Trichinella spiralis]|uniref:Uncharacterized protein n=1 Tax=Trichinella spiralis TaxID=6334 RepID=A0A0V1AYB4_TRISP|nr:hypothetical protein T01_13979 [Trichinella spiralis]